MGLLLWIPLGWLAWCVVLGLALGLLYNPTDDPSGDGAIAMFGLWLMGTGIAPAVWAYQWVRSKLC